MNAVAAAAVHAPLLLAAVAAASPRPVVAAAAAPPPVAVPGTALDRLLDGDAGEPPAVGVVPTPPRHDARASTQRDVSSCRPEHRL